ncbi:MAG TPA: NAD(+)/NADH kinase [Clostridiaceae bacterium]|nr:NAD(+)/NADH kinase [Clostridiaceae bacterium]
MEYGLKVIGVVVGRNKDTEYEHTKLIIEKLLNRGFKVMVPPGGSSCAGLPVIESSTLFKDSDFIICVGGDGTFLSTARKAFAYRKPVLGINKGTVGFLAEVEISEIETAIDSLVNGQFRIQPRMVLVATVERNGEKVYENIAINDAVITRMALSRILRLMVMIDDKYADSFPGDGVIISTPTGSTGYSLSAGGPIVQPDMRLVIISPICPHILHSRSYIASDSKTVSVIIDDKSEIDAILTLDGQEGFKLEPGDKIFVKASEDSALFATVKNMDFYDIIRAKIHKSN